MKVLKWLDENFEEYLMVFLLIAIAVIMMLQIVMRYIFSASLPWPEEAGRYLWIVTTCLSISYCIKKDCALRVDTLLQALPKKLQKILSFFINLVMLLIHGFMFYYSLITLKSIYAVNQVSPALMMPTWILYVGVALGFGLGTVRCIQVLVKEIKGGTEKC